MTVQLDWGERGVKVIMCRKAPRCTGGMMGITAIEASPTYAKCTSRRDTSTRIHKLMLMLMQFGAYGMGERVGMSVTSL